MFTEPILASQGMGAIFYKKGKKTAKKGQNIGKLGQKRRNICKICELYLEGQLVLKRYFDKIFCSPLANLQCF